MSEDALDEPLLPLRARADLRIEAVEYREETCYVVKDPVRLKYFRLQPEQMVLLECLRLPRTMAQLRRELQRRFPTLHIETAAIRQLLQDLYRKNLIFSQRVGQSTGVQHRHYEEQRRKITAALQNPMFVKFPGWDPDAMLGRLQTGFGWLLSPLWVAITLIFVAGSFLFAFAHAEEVYRDLPGFHEFFSWPNVLYLWFVIGFTKFLHELGHGMACKRYGGECREMGILLLVFSPTMFCDTSDSWTFQSKWQRMAVAAAGMYVEMVLAAAAILLWWHAQGGMLQHLCLNVFVVSTIATLLFNLNPLMRFDGYFILADWLETPNLQTKASQTLQHMLAYGCFGIQLPASPLAPRRDRGLYASYAVLASVYRVVIMLGIAFFLYTILKPYRLEAIGLVLALVLVSMMVFKQVQAWYRIFSAPRKHPLSRPRMLVSLLLLGCLAMLFLMVPVPWCIDAPCYLQPVQGREVLTAVEGSVAEVLVQAGDHVTAGQRLLVLDNADLKDRELELRTERLVAEAQREAARVTEDYAAAFEAEQRIQSIAREQEQLKIDQQRLEIVAPIAGRVIEPPRREELPVRELSDALAQWSGTPLQVKNRGAWLERETPVCTIAPSPRAEAVIMVALDDAKYIRAAQTVRIKFEHRAGMVITSRVNAVSERTTLACPAPLNQRNGGPFVTYVNSEGAEKLTEAKLPATANLDMAWTHCQSDLRGTARIVVADYSLGGWIRRWFLSKLRFRL